MGCVHHIILLLILETINSINPSPTEVFHFFRTKHCPHAMKPIINHSPIWSTNKKNYPARQKNGKHHQRKDYFYSVRRGSPPKSVSVALLGKKTRRQKISFPNCVIVYHVRAEVNEPHRTARIAEELQQDRLQVHGENPWKGLRYVNTHCLFHDISNHKKIEPNPHL